MMGKMMSVVGAIVLLSFSPGRDPGHPPDPQPGVRSTLAASQPDFGALPLYFVRHQTEEAGAPLFYADAAAYRLLVAPAGLTFDFRTAEGSEGRDGDVASLDFLGANPGPVVRAVDPADYVVHRFIGNDPSRWQVDLPTAKAVRYEALYAGVDLEVYGVQGEVEYDWIVRPGGRADDIRFAYRGARRCGIGADGDLRIEMESATLVQRRPDCYQIADGRRVAVESSFISVGPDTFGFRVGGYDPERDLFIDPLVLVYSTFLGGDVKDWGWDLAVDAKGSLYVTGLTCSVDFPVKDARQPRFKGGVWDAFLTKFAPDGRSLVFSTYLGGNRLDHGFAVALGKDGSIYLAGETESTDFPLANPVQSEVLNLRADAFVARLAKNGKGLIFSTYLGGPDQDFGYGVAVDADGSAVVVGACGEKFPVKKAIRPKFSRGTYDGFVAKIPAKGGSLAFSTYWGGGGWDSVEGVALDGQGQIYVVGFTNGKGFPIKKAFQKAFGGGPCDGFISRLAADGQTIGFSSYLGGSGHDIVNAVALGADGALFVAGTTMSSNFPTQAAYQSSLGGKEDGFLTKMAADDRSLIYSTYLGGPDADRFEDLVVDASGYAYVAGYSFGSAFPGAPPADRDGATSLQAILAVFKPNGRSLVGARCLGGPDDDRFYGVAADGKGAFYVTGVSWSASFPVKNAFQPRKALYADAVVMKFKR
ncbi:MAG: SBBP repeat-containing protein [Candidatus Aminicenantes bacterium]|nr:SBBP repeat-containing protein [Candidatus Aminicenantes bacterium]